MRKWIIPTLSEILASNDTQYDGCGSNSCLLSADSEARTLVGAPIKPEQQWRMAIAALEKLLQQSLNHKDTDNENCAPSTQGVVLAGPVPVISNTQLTTKLPAWIFTEDLWQHQLLPADITRAAAQKLQVAAEPGVLLPLIPGDPLAREQFCLVLTAQFSFVMVLADAHSVPAFFFSFEPEVVEQAWYTLRARAALTTSESVLHLDELFQQYYPTAPDYRVVMHFSRLLLQHLPELPREEIRNSAVQNHSVEQSYSVPRSDIELLQAFAHEVRTPLTTIRTLTRLLLKRRDLASDAIKRLEIIDHECTEQIDRMELIFRAVELESTVKQPGAYLTAMSLAQVLQQSVPRWQKQASRRNLTLEVVLPQQLPTVVSDPRMLDQVLTGLIENFTRSLPAGSHIQVQVIPAGDQLKLQLLPQSQLGENGQGQHATVPPIRKSLGQLLTFQPETGNISLNITATKQLFQAIGGKLIVRQRPDEGEVLTIFLPLDVKQTEYCS